MINVLLYFEHFLDVTSSLLASSCLGVKRLSRWFEMKGNRTREFALGSRNIKLHARRAVWGIYHGGG
jgi:hypothetical protein